jgi:hypothetical protein
MFRTRQFQEPWIEFEAGHVVPPLRQSECQASVTGAEFEDVQGAVTAARVKVHIPRIASVQSLIEFCLALGHSEVYSARRLVDASRESCRDANPNATLGRPTWPGRADSGLAFTCITQRILGVMDVGQTRESAGRLARWLIDKGRPDEAVALLSAWAANGPNDSDGQQLLAEALRIDPSARVAQMAFERMEGMTGDHQDLDAAIAAYPTTELEKLEKEMKRPTFRRAQMGFNNNIKWNGQVFHVQTEDSGLDQPCSGGTTSPVASALPLYCRSSQ